jgi:putative pyruvate formate lyase activating enzyme
MLARSIELRRKEGSLNVNLVGGEPTPQLLWILETLKHCGTNLPVLWNSNMYMSQKTMKILDGVVDMYLSDFKYGSDQCALRLSKVKNFFEVCSRNHLMAAKQAELVIRHLIIPNHFECCTKPVFDWIGKNLQQNSLLNIMDQFKPDFHAKENPEIGRGITEEELKQAVDYAKKLKLNFIT